MTADANVFSESVEALLERYAQQHGGMIPLLEVQALVKSLHTCHEDLERSHKVIRRESERHRRIIQAGPLVVFVWRMQYGWPVEFASENVAQFGFTAEEFTSGGRSWSSIIHSDDRAALEAEVARYIEQCVDDFFQEYRLVTDDGRVRWVISRTVATKDATGTTTHLTGAILDITERKESEDQIRTLNATLEARVAERTAQLRESEVNYRSLSENTEDIHYAMLSDGTLAYMGPQVVRYGHSADLLQGMSFADFVHPEDAARLQEELQRTLTTGEVFPSEFRIVDIAGNVHWLEERSTAEVDAEGRIVKLTGLLRDITARKQADQERMEQQDRLRRLAAKLSTAQDEERRRIAEGLHDDVAQLLTACSLKLAISRKVNGEEERNRLLDEADQMLAETQDAVRLLSFELASSTLYRLGFGEAIRELCEGIRERYGLICESAGTLPAGCMDEATSTVAFRSVRELLFNVVKHAGASKARITMGCEQGFVCVRVSDSGRGFSHETAREISSCGDGFGLFGIQERLRDLGGHMQIESTPGEDTCVTLWLPECANGNGTNGEKGEGGDERGKNTNTDSVGRRPHACA